MPFAGSSPPTAISPLAQLISPAGLAELGSEARRLEADAVRRDFRMPCMDDSPRHMTTLGGDHIARTSPSSRRPTMTRT